MKKHIIIILLSFVCFIANAQTPLPSGFPTQFNTGWQSWGYQQSTLGTIIATRDTSWLPRYCGTMVLWAHAGVDTAYWMWDCVKWKKLSSSGDITSVTANNGLTKTGSNIQQGGPLVQFTDIPNAGFDYFIHGTGQNIFRTQNGTFQSNIATSSIAAQLTANNSGTGFFSEVNAIEGAVSLNGGDNGTFYSNVNVSRTAIDLVTRANTSPHIFRYDFNGKLLIDSYTGSNFQTSDTSMNALVVDGSGNVFKRAGDGGGGGGGGSVTNVSGTTNRITVTNPTTTPVIDIAATYVGQTSITTLGTIATGVWNGTAIGATFGGTGQTTVTTGDLLYGSATNTWSKLADVATGNALISGGVTTAPSWGKIGLTTHVSGILPIANGGTGTATPALVAGTNISITGSWPNQTINATGSGTIQSQQSITGDGSSGNKVRFVNDVTIPKKGDVYTAVVGYDSSRGWQQWEENFRGDIYKTNSWSSFSTGFTNTGSVTGDIVNGNLHFTGGALYGSLALTTPYTAIDNYIFTDTVVINEKSGTSYGSGIGTVSVNNSIPGSSDVGIFLRFIAYTGGGSGTLALTAGVAHTVVATSSALTFSAGDTLLRTFTRDGWSYTGSIRNLTTNSAPVTLSYTFTSSGDVMPNTGRFAIYFLGGEFTINGWTVSSNSNKNARVLLKGDSRMVGYIVTSQAARLGDLLNGNFKNTIVSAGGFDRTTEALLTLPEDSLLKSQQVVICLGYNDLATGTSLATTEANLDSIYNFYIAHNIDPYFLLVATVSPGTSTTALNAYLRSTYPTRIFDCEQLMLATGALQADGVHWTDYGNQLLYDFIVSQYKLYGGNTRYGGAGADINGTINYYSMFTAPTSLGNAPQYQDGVRITATLPFEQNNTNPDYVWFDNDAGANEKIWSTETNSGVMTWRTVNDARSAATGFMQFIRSGNDISLMRFLKLSRFEGGVQLYNTLTGSSSDSILVQENSTGNVKRIAPITGGINTLNTLTATTQTFATGTSGSDFAISSSSSTHTFNIPDAATGARGLVTTGTQTFGGLKTFNSGATILAPFTLTLGSDATGDTYYRTGGTVVRRAIGSTDDVYTVSGGVPIWVAPNYSFGTYTPTLTNVTNISASTAYQCQYMRVGNVVTVSGKVDIDPGAVGLATLGISIPIASALANDFECGGTAAAGTVLGLNGAISADPANDRVELDFTIPVAGVITNTSWFFTFTYYIDIS